MFAEEYGDRKLVLSDGSVLPILTGVVPNRHWIHIERFMQSKADFGAGRKKIDKFMCWLHPIIESIMNEPMHLEGGTIEDDETTHPDDAYEFYWTKPAGVHHVSWNGKDGSGNQMPSGMYLYQIESNGFVQSKKMQLLK